MHIAVAITGASGSVYARRLVEKLSPLAEVSVVFTANGRSVTEYETGIDWVAESGVRVWENTDFFSPLASGSSGADVMVIVPCSMGMLGRIAAGTSDDLVSRAADVMLKERRRLIIVPRETPLNLIHLRNMTTLAEAGTVILPAMPSFYSRPESIEALVDTVVDRIIGLLGFDNDAFRWGDESR